MSMRVLLPLVLAAPIAALSCAECSTLQEAIQRSIVANISAFEAKGAAGTTVTATIEIGQIIWHLCDSETWRAQRYRPSLDTACRDAVRTHVDLMTEYWKEKTSDEYKDSLIALRMKRAVCPNEKIGACSLDELPSDYEPLRPSECALCRAVVSDLYGVVRLSRERPTTAKNDNYFRLVGLMGKVCEDLPMRHAMRPKERNAVTELCEDVWDEHEAALSKLALRRSDEYARTVCTEQLDLCEDELPLGGIASLDTRAPKEEL